MNNKKIVLHFFVWVLALIFSAGGLFVLHLVSQRESPVPVASAPPVEKVGRLEDKADAVSMQAVLAELPLRFIPNYGQIDPVVRFQVQSQAGSIFFAPDEIIFTLPSAISNESKSIYEPVVNISSPTRTASLLRLTFAQANLNPHIEGISPLPGVTNFFIGDDPARWQSNLPAYQEIIYREMYPGIDLAYQGTAGQLKSEFRVAPGADPTLIRMRYDGLKRAYVRADGALVLETPGGELIEAPPHIYQQIEAEQVQISGRYQIVEKYTSDLKGTQSNTYVIAFQIDPYNSAYPLIIDPEIAYSTYLGGSGTDVGVSIAADEAGNAYVTGITNSVDFPVYNEVPNSCVNCGSSSAFVTQIISAAGVYTYGFSTYLGGSNGELGGLGIVVDEAGAVYVTGDTPSPDFPTLNEIQACPNSGNPSLQNTDIFVTKIISVSGVYTLAYSTCLGGSDNDTGAGIAVDQAGNAYLTGVTWSADLPVKNAIQETCSSCDATPIGVRDAFVAKIIEAGGVYTLGYLTYLGGNDLDWGYSVAVDKAGNAYVTGFTSSTDFPTFRAIQDHTNVLSGTGSDAFITHIISANGVYTYGFSTYLGGSSEDIGEGIVVDETGAVYVTGSTRSSNFPLVNEVQDYRGNGDAYITQIISAGGVYTYGFSTFLGGSGQDAGSGIALDKAGNIYVVGTTGSIDYPTQDKFQDNTATDNSDTLDAFVTQLIRADGVYTWGYSTYLGGNNIDRAGEINSIAVDGAGNVYVVGETASTDFPTLNELQTNADTDGSIDLDVFVTKIKSTLPVSPTLPNSIAYLPVVLKP